MIRAKASFSSIFIWAFRFIGDTLGLAPGAPPGPGGLDCPKAGGAAAGCPVAGGAAAGTPGKGGSPDDAEGGDG